MLQRQQLIRSLKADLGQEAVAEADRRVRDELSTPGAKSGAVDRLLGELEAMAGERRGCAEQWGVVMHAASREAMQAVQRQVSMR